MSEDHCRNLEDGADADARTERFVALMNQHQTRLATFVESLVLDYQAAQDLLQETNLILWRKRDDFQEGTNFWAWGCKVAYHQVLHFRRSQGRNKLVFGEELIEQLADVSQLRLESHDDHKRLLRQCLAELPPRQRRVVEQRYREEASSVGAIAKRQRMTPNAVSKLIQRARTGLLSCVQHKLAAEATQ